MSTEKNIILQQFNGADYDTLYPKTKVEQVEGAYTQQQILADSTKTLYGLGADAVPDDVLALLGPYVQYWWRATKKGYVEYRAPAAQVTLTQALTVRPIYYSNSLSVDFATGEIKLINPQTVNADYDSPSTLTVLRGKYFTNIKNAPNDIYFAEQNATVTTEQGYPLAYYVFLSNCSRVTSLLKEGESTYLRNTDRNAYPDSGIVDGMEYVFLGKPLDNAPSAAKIETGSYVGTGTYGDTNPIGLTAPGKPKFVFVTQKAQSVSSERGYYFTAVVNQKTAMVERVATDSTSTAEHFVQLSWGDKTVSWYSTVNAERQLNISGTEYVYVIFY